MSETAPADSAPTPEYVIGMYRKLRTAKENLAKEHQAQMKPINEKLAKLENWLHTMLNDGGINSVATDAGTAFKSELVKASVTDGEELLKFVQENDLWHILERRVSKTAVQEYIESTGQAVPGVHVTREERINIRKPAK